VQQRYGEEITVILATSLKIPPEVKAIKCTLHTFKNLVLFLLSYVDSGLSMGRSPDHSLYQIPVLFATQNYFCISLARGPNYEQPKENMFLLRL
jgi:hypothetical protein